MIDIITNEDLIAKYQDEFVNQLETICEQDIKCSVGYQGGSHKEDLFFIHQSMIFGAKLITKAKPDIGMHLGLVCPILINPTPLL